MQDGFINIIVILGIIVGVLFFYSRSVQLDVYVKEGMTTRSKGDPEPTSDAADRVSDLEIKLDKLKTSVSIDANRKNYENMIINFEDIISLIKEPSLNKKKIVNLKISLEDSKKIQNIDKDFAEIYLKNMTIIEIIILDNHNFINNLLEDY